MATLPAGAETEPADSSLWSEDLRESRGLRRKGRSWLFVAAAAVALFVASPILVIVASPLLEAGGSTWQHLRETVLGTYITNSVLLALGAGAGAGLLGVSTAWFTAVYRFPGRSWVDWLLLLPLAMPTYLVAYAYTDFLVFDGPVQTWLRTVTGLSAGEMWFPPIRSLGGAIVLFSLVLYPYVYLLCRASFLEQSVCVLDASRTLGMSRTRSFWRVALPMARPALAGGIALVAMESLADFGAVDYFAVDTFTTGIYRTWFGLGAPVAAAQLAAGLLGVVVLLLVLERLSRGKRRFHGTTTKRQDLPGWPLRGWRGLAALAFCLLPVLLGFGVPVGILVEASLTAGFLPSLEDSLTWTGHSLLLATVAALLAVAASLLLAYNNRLCAGPASRALTGMASLGYAVPGSVIAVGILLLLGGVDRALGGATGLVSGTLFALVFAYLVRFLTLGLHAVDAGMARIQPNLDQAGRTLRSSALGVLGRVHFPLLRASSLAAALLVFVEVLKELPATLMIRPFNFDTLAVRIYQLASDERFAESAAPALLIVAAGLVPVVFLSRMMRGGRGEQ
jgi:iron(III) transport system permease protein